MPTQQKSPRLRIVILGSAAGGGYPQWNCRCNSCALAWSNLQVAQTQCSVAFSSNGDDWHLINASPDIRQQILSASFLHPRKNRDSPIKSVWLSCADIDATAGLFQLREQIPLSIYASSAVLKSVQSNPFYHAFNPSLVSVQAIEEAGVYQLPDGIQVTSIEVPGKVPLYEEHPGAEKITSFSNAFLIKHEKGSESVLVCPGAAALTPTLLSAAQKAKLILFDGTLYSNKELIEQELRQRTGQQMAHMSMSGENGSLEGLKDVKAEKVYIHINNSNPVWNPKSQAAAEILECQWTVGQQGMEWVLC